MVSSQRGCRPHDPETWTTSWQQGRLMSPSEGGTVSGCMSGCGRRVFLFLRPCLTIYLLLPWTDSSFCLFYPLQSWLKVRMHFPWYRLANQLMTVCSGSACKVKDVQSTSYTTTDGLVISHVALIANFNLVCENNVPSDNLQLFAEIPAIKRIMPVTRSVDGKGYQVSWTEEVAKASYGDRNVRIFDEAGLAAIEKAQDSGSSIDSVQPLLSLTVNHRGTYRGPLIPMEMIAVLAVVLVWYSAYSAKVKLVSWTLP